MTLVEFALIVPILMLLIFGVIDFGNAYNNSLSLRQGVRDGARQAAVGAFGNDQGTGASTCALTPSTGNAATNEIICLAKSRIGLTNSNVRVAVMLSGGAIGGANGTYAVGSPIVVCAQTPVKSVTGLFSPFLNGKFQTTEVEMRIETAASGTQVAGTQPITAAETAPSGSSWSFCQVK